MKKSLPVIIFLSLIFLYIGPLSTLDMPDLNVYKYIPYIGSIFVLIFSLISINNTLKNTKDFYEIIPLILYLICGIGIFFVYYPYGFN